MRILSLRGVGHIKRCAMAPHEETERLPQISLRPEHDGRKEVDVFFSSFFLSDLAADSLWSGSREGNGKSGGC